MNNVVVLNTTRASKINWTQLISLAAMLATVAGYTVPPDLVPTITAAIGAVSAVLTIVFRTWFTGTPVIA